MIIKAEIRNKIINFVLPGPIVSSAVGDLFIHFDFDSEWERLGKTAYFTINDKTYFAAVDAELTAVPDSALTKSGALFISVSGVSPDGKHRIVTQACEALCVERSGVYEGNPPETVNISFFEECMAKAELCLDETLSARNEAITASDAAALAAKEASSAKESAEKSAVQVISVSGSFESSVAAAMADIDSAVNNGKSDISTASQQLETELSGELASVKNAALAEINSLADSTEAVMRSLEASAEESKVSAANSASAADKALAGIGSSISVHDSSLIAHKDIRGLIAGHISDSENPHEITAEQLGLGNVDNTSDIDKPISTAMQQLLNTKAPVGYGLGDILYNNNILNPLLTGLKTGTYGVFSGMEGTVNLPPYTSYLIGWVNVYNYDSSPWQGVELHDIRNHKTWTNDYSAEAHAWSGWKELISSLPEDISSEFSYGSGVTEHVHDLPLNVIRIGKQITLSAYIDVHNSSTMTWFSIPSKYLGFNYTSGIQIAGAAYYLSSGLSYPLYVHNAVGVYTDANLPTGECRVRLQWVMA